MGVDLRRGREHRMRAHIRGTGLVLGLAITVFGSPAAWADSADSVVKEATDEAVNEITGINEPGSIPAAPGDPDAQPPKRAPET
ncbi:MAG: hypothetical protein ACRDRV_19500, partial [Pseudonocardiaceae bacterium]